MRVSSEQGRLILGLLDDSNSIQRWACRLLHIHCHDREETVPGELLAMSHLMRSSTRAGGRLGGPTTACPPRPTTPRRFDASNSKYAGYLRAGAPRQIVVWCHK